MSGLSASELLDTTSQTVPKDSVNALKFLQLMNSLGIFLIPALLFTLLSSGKILQPLQLNRRPSMVSLLLLFPLFFTFLPLINLTVEWNANMQLPTLLAPLEDWMRQSEDQAMQLTQAFLQMDSVGDLMINLLLIALLPALGEELIFRGIVQQIINKGNGNYHIGVWLSAILFSALHLQFYGFLPRLLLGAFFGYLFVWSGNLWVPILVHFINNATALLATYTLGPNVVKEDFDTIGATESTYLFTAISFVLFLYLLKVFQQLHKRV
jgi:membrane protease YdiL (CAAX protease family)